MKMGVLYQKLALKLMENLKQNIYIEYNFSNIFFSPTHLLPTKIFLMINNQKSWLGPPLLIIHRAQLFFFCLKCDVTQFKLLLLLTIVSENMK